MKSILNDKLYFGVDANCGTIQTDEDFYHRVSTTCFSNFVARKMCDYTHEFIRLITLFNEMLRIMMHTFIKIRKKKKTTPE